MTYSLNSSSNDPRVDDLRRQHQKQLSRFFVTFALIEGVLLIAAAIAVYGLELIDPAQGIWILVGIAALGGFVMSGVLLSLTRRHTQEMRDITGG
jgi:hypothetical protein